MKRLMVAVDGCAPSLCAAKKAIELAEKYGTEVIVLYVEEKTPMLPSEKTFENTLIKDKITDYPLELMSEYGKLVGANLQLVKTQGKITGKIIRLANEFGVDMIVIGDSARKGMERLHFGSVAESVLKDSALPVLVVKRGSVDLSDLKALAEAVNAKHSELSNVEPEFISPYQETYRRNRLVSFSYFSVFALVYFGCAIINSATFQSIAVLPFGGVPLGVWAGFSVFPVALVLCALYLKTGGN